MVLDAKKQRLLQVLQWNTKPVAAHFLKDLQHWSMTLISVILPWQCHYLICICISYKVIESYLMKTLSFTLQVYIVWGQQWTGGSGRTHQWFDRGARPWCRHRGWYCTGSHSREQVIMFHKVKHKETKVVTGGFCETWCPKQRIC